MRGRWAGVEAAALVTLAVMAATWEAAASPARAGLAPHLGYGVNLRYLENVDTIFAPLDFGWVKLYERFDTMPSDRLPHQVLYRIDIGHGDRWVWVDGSLRPDLDTIRADVLQIAQDGLGLVDAYEIGNEPNMHYEWQAQPPDPADYVAVLQVAYEAIKEVDPSAIVVSGGLGPVGRIGGPTGEDEMCAANSGELYFGHNCYTMDERLYAREMFNRGAGYYFDAFGYHPTGFAYEPERALGDLPSHDNGNGFAFRGAEVMRGIMEQYGLDSKPVWATEFGWLRDPSDDGFARCHGEDGQAEFAICEWFDLPEVQQANYLTRAFQYADENWPWMGAMFVWAFDFHQQGADCQPGRYFSVRKYDGTIEGAPSLAYSALMAMVKRPGHFGPRLAVAPTTLTFLASVGAPRVFTGTFLVQNTGYGVMTWTASVATGMDVTPTLVFTAGLEGRPLTVTVDSTGYLAGRFTGMVTVTATTADVLDVPQGLPVTLVVAQEVDRVLLPIVVRSKP